MFCDLNAVTNRYQATSVHLTDFPKVKEELINKDLEERMQLARQISSMVLSLRKRHNLRVRQPLAKIMIPAQSEHFKQQVNAVKNLILSEVNVKEIDFLSPDNNILVKNIKPNFKTLGPKYGKIMKSIAAVISKFSQAEIALLESQQSCNLMVEGVNVELQLSDVEIFTRDIPGWVVANEGNITVALDVTVTTELQEEGLARELVNRIQNYRKDCNFDVMDKIWVKISHHDALVEVLNRFGTYICSETLADKLEMLPALEGEDTVKVELIEGISVDMIIRKA